MKTLFHWLIGLFLLAGTTSLAAPPPPESGTAFCVRAAPDSACRASWKWSVVPRAFQWLQRFEPAFNLWRSVATMPAQRSGQHEAVAEGHLYRFVSCADESALIDCVYSTMTWAPLRPATVADIPKWVVTEDGTMVHVAKNGRYRDELRIFNAVKLLQHLQRIDWSALPAMTEITREAARTDVWASVDEQINGSGHASMARYGVGLVRERSPGRGGASVQGRVVAASLVRQ